MRSRAFIIVNNNKRRYIRSTSVLLEAAASDTTPFIDPTTLNKNSDLLIPYPASLSPSSILEFKKCPQSFLFQYLWKLRQPTNAILTKGIVCHSALEKVFDLQKEDRTIDNLQNLYRSVWSEKRKKEPYDTMFESIEEERTWGLDALQLLQNYIELENPSAIKQPFRREVWVNSKLSTDPKQGDTYNNDDNDDKNDKNDNDKNDTFLVRGIVDRMDIVPSNNDNSYNNELRIVDYKTGKAPDFKYSPSMNEKIFNESMEQLKIYALLLHPQQDVRYLRLFYLKSKDTNKAQFLDYDLGDSKEQRMAELHRTHEGISNVWEEINTLVKTQDPTLFKPCTRSFCYCHKCRPRFSPGTLAELPPSEKMSP